MGSRLHGNDGWCAGYTKDPRRTARGPSCARRPVSRVLSPRAHGFTPALAGFLPMCAGAAAIYLAPPLPTGSSGQPGDWSGAVVPLFDLAPDGVCHAPGVATGAVSSYLAISPLSRMTGTVCFLWHFPSGRPAPPLAGILARWCSDFPPSRRIGTAAARPSCAPPF